LTIAFVLVAEMLVLIPAISRQRIQWLNARIEAAYLVGLALEGPEFEMIKPEEADRLLSTAGVLGVMIDRDGANVLVSAPAADLAAPPDVHFIDLAGANPATMISDAWSTFFSTGDDWVRVLGRPAYAPGERIDILVSQRALRHDLFRYAWNVLLISLVISSITGLLLYLALDLMTVRPLRRLARHMTAFQQNPEDPGQLLPQSARADEIGVAERGLRELESRIQGLLSQRRRLAALGAGVSKISHDLRNILASAQLMSDRLASSEDPRVRKLSPRLIQSLDRAIALSRDTLAYARMEPASLAKSAFLLAPLVEEAFEDAASLHVDFVSEVPADLAIVADRNQLYRALFNIVRNSVDALTPAEGDEKPAAGRLVVKAEREGSIVRIEIADNGPGIAEDARAGLFEPFRGSTKPGGAGLGLAIAHEIARAHGGDLELAPSIGLKGATFEFSLPQPA
ncbi:MAG: HAMP domain-containing sensor histidine kinase, partial [Parvularculaceae bacterium]